MLASTDHQGQLVVFTYKEYPYYTTQASRTSYTTTTQGKREWDIEWVTVDRGEQKDQTDSHQTEHNSIKEQTVTSNKRKAEDAMKNTGHTVTSNKREAEDAWRTRNTL